MISKVLMNQEFLDFHMPDSFLVTVDQVNRMIDGRPVQFTNTIQDNTWVTEVVTDGSPEMKVLHKRAGDELHVKETLGDLEIHDVWVKVAESD